MRRRTPPGALVAVALILLGGCTEPADDATGLEPSSVPSTGSAQASDTASPPVAPTPTTNPANWQPVGAPVGSTVTANNGGWTVTVDEERSRALLEGSWKQTISGSKRFRVDHVLLDAAWALVVRGDSLHQRPARAVVIDLASGDSWPLDGRSDPPTVNGGTWALDGSVLVHATEGPDGDYCLARRDLSAGPRASGEIVHCAPDRHGFANARLTPTGIGLMSFDDSRPSCRTLGVVTGGTFAPQQGIEDCTGWELVPTQHGPVWSVIPNENELDVAHVYAESADGTLDLGLAVAGSLTWCNEATYFARDPGRAGEPATLMRWDDRGLATVYETSGAGQAFLSAPRCGGDHLSISVFAESGDQQLSTVLGVRSG